MKTTSFPENFLWGAAISSYQTEGNNVLSDWGDRAGKACDFWNRYEYYLDLAKALKLSAFRLSFEWSRVNPSADDWNKDALERYLEIIRAIRERGMEPFVTLWHFTLPQWVARQGSWTNPKSIAYFVAYVSKLTEFFKEEEPFHLLTLNEPRGYLFQSYLTGKWPPQRKFAILASRQVHKNLLKAHHEAAWLIRQALGSRWKIGIALNLPDMVGTRLLVSAARPFSDWAVLEGVAESCDFIGVNYYFHDCLRPVPRWPFIATSCGNLPASDLGWELYPQGILPVILGCVKFGKPIYITENGLADKTDKHRPGFLHQSLIAVEDAIKAGADVRGYFHWSLMDNYEWGFKLGDARFGLYETDFKNFTAKPRPSAKFYKAIIENNGASGTFISGGA